LYVCEQLGCDQGREMNEQKAASPPCSKTISGVTGDVKNRQLESKRILALMNASVKGNPSLERDFKRYSAKLCE
jgi:hypothetical protein